MKKLLLKYSIPFFLLSFIAFNKISYAIEPGDTCPDLTDGDWDWLPISNFISEVVYIYSFNDVDTLTCPIIVKYMQEVCTKKGW